MKFGAHVVLASVLCVPGTVLAAVAEIAHDAPHVDLNSHFEYLADEEGQWTLEQVSAPPLASRFVPNPGGSFNAAFTTSPYWYRLQLRLSAGAPPVAWRRYVEFSYALLDRVEFYAPQPGGGYRVLRAGDQVPLSEWPVNDRQLLFPVDLTPGEIQTVYLRVQTDGQHEVSLTLWTPEAFLRHSSSNLALLGLYYGVVLIVVLAAAVIFGLRRERTYLDFTLYALFQGALLPLGLNGLGTEYLWGDWLYWNNASPPFHISAVALFGTRFAQSFLDTRAQDPALHRVLNGFVALAVLAIVLSLAAPLALSIRVALVAVFSASLVGLATVVRALFRGGRAARFFMVAIAIQVLSILIKVLQASAVLPTNPPTFYSLQIGMLIAIIVFALALADRINLEFQENRRSLQARVAERTRELDEASQVARDNAERLRGLTDNSPVLLWEMHQPAGVERASLAYMSHGAERFYFPYTSADLVRDVNLGAEAIHPDDRDRYIWSFLQVASAQPTRFEYEYRTRRPDGSYRWVHAMSVSRRLDDGARVHYGVTSDIHPLKALQEDLGKARELAEAANQAKSNFLAAMSHEIRTPMIGVTGMLEVLTHTQLDADQRRAVSVIQQSADSLLRIIGDILDFSKIEAGRLDLEPASVSLGKLVNGVAENFTPPASAKGLYLVCEVDPGLAPAHLADPVRVRQILANFLSNALKFTSRGGVRLSAHVAEQQPGRQRVEFSVADTGIGISEENQQKLFQPFSQAESTTTRRFGGTGLGLSICRRLAELMGGEVTLRSHDGVGTTLRFRCEFPLADAAQVEERVAASIQRVTGTRPPTRSHALAEGSLLLLVEDNPTNRLVLGQQFELAGFTVDYASDGRMGFDMWREARYGAVFTDLHMPGKDGKQLVRAIREVEQAEGRARTPVLALTAAALKEELAGCLEAGMDDVVIKPTTVPILAGKLRSWLPHLPWEEAAAMRAPAGDGDGDGAAAVLDRGVLRELTGGNADFLRTVLDDFAESAGGDLRELGDRIADRDGASVTRSAHRLTGASLIVGATELAGIARELEAAGKREDWNAIQALRPEMETAFARVRHQMRELR